MVFKVLSYNRLVLIERYIHFVDNNSLGERYKKTAKIAPLHDYLSEKFSVMYTSERDISMDESLLLWKGSLSWKQYIPNKRSRFGLKSFVLCEAKTGYVWKSVLYTGKELTEHLDEAYNGYHYQATKVVLRLVNNLLGKGYRLFIDNYYTSYEITSCLLQNKTDSVGTLRRDQKHLPKALTDKNLKLKVCERKVRYESETGIMCTRWKDKKDVFTMSTCVEDGILQVRRAGQPKDIPKVIDTYNKNMGGVDCGDQMLTSYEIERKRVKKWYKTFFYHLVNVGVFNAHIIATKLGSKVTQLQFREELIESLFLENQNTGSSRKRGRQSTSNLARLAGRHVPSFIQPNEMKENSSRRCKVCSKNTFRKESRYQCKECDVGLCVAPCFEYYHTKKDFSKIFE